jgi:signal transduction histidine kinase
MNKIRGSFLAKIIAWILFIASATMAVMSIFIFMFNYSNGVYSANSISDVLGNNYNHINRSCSLDVWLNYRNNGGSSDNMPSEMYEKGFRYGIIEADDISGIDFNNKDSYEETNFFMGDIVENIDRDNLYLFKLTDTTGGNFTETSTTYTGKYNIFGQNTTAVETVTETADIDWVGLYADAVCYDEAGGIFYYRAEGDYYPVQNVIFYYKSMEYNYNYDFEKEKYRLNYYRYTGNMINAYDSNLDTSSIEYKLACKDDNYITFDVLYDYNFPCESWGTILLDGIREIKGDELTKIYSTAISDSHFIKEAGYYLDENYTLIVEQLLTKKNYWVFSVIPENVTPDLNGNQYEQSAWYIQSLYWLRIVCIIAFAVSVIIAVLSLVYLINAAGYRKGSSEIHIMAFPDKIPFDIWSIIILTILVAMVAVLVWVYEGIDNIVSAYNMGSIGNLDMLVSVALNVVMAIFAIGLWYILGFAVRVKKGKWWQNTVCYRIINSIKKAINKIWENIGLIWKFIAIVVALFVIRVLTVNLFDTNMLFVVNILIKIVAYIVIIRMIIQFGQLQKASRKLAEGDLSYKVDTTKMLFEFKEHGNNLNRISEGMAKAVEEKMKSERFKTELITNVSHDIKTPLTSIINYVDLLGKEELNNDKATEYLEVLDRQSSKLKKLIEDLVEASKASSGNLSVNLEKMDACVFITQTVGEFEEKLSIAGLELIVNKPDKPVYIMADGRHLWRVVDNLMNNICKYAQPQSRVYVSLEADEKVRITFRNISKYQLNVTGDELMERFVRGDKSRNTEGHGLGLSIAQSLVTLMNGEMSIVVDGDLFKVVISF